MIAVEHIAIDSNIAALDNSVSLAIATTCCVAFAVGCALYLHTAKL